MASGAQVWCPQVAYTEETVLGQKGPPRLGLVLQSLFPPLWPGYPCPLDSLSFPLPSLPMAGGFSPEH